MNIRKMNLITKIFISVLLGIVFGAFFESVAIKLEIGGMIFLRLMMMSIPLLVLGQIIQALSEIKTSELSSIGFKTIAIFGISSLLAAVWGILFGLIFKPGVGINMNAEVDPTITAQSISIKDTIVEFFPKNIVESLSNGTIVQIIVFALFFGIALNMFINEHKKSEVHIWIVEFNEIIMNIIKTVMNLAPIGVFCLIASTISKSGLAVILPLLKYLIVFAGATLVFMGIWIMIVSVYCKMNIKTILYGIKDMSLVAISTTSSAITLPIAMEDAKNKLNISNRVVDLVLPLGVSLNSNGAAMHIAITAITVAQLYGITYDVPMLLYIAVLSTLVSLANAVVPGASLVSLAIIIPQVGLPIESIALFAGVDYFVGMIRTILNVDSDVFSAMLVAKSIGEIEG